MEVESIYTRLGSMAVDTTQADEDWKHSGFFLKGKPYNNNPNQVRLVLIRFFKSTEKLPPPEYLEDEGIIRLYYYKDRLDDLINMFNNSNSNLILVQYHMRKTEKGEEKSACIDFSKNLDKVKLMNQADVKMLDDMNRNTDN